MKLVPPQIVTQTRPQTMRLMLRSYAAVVVCALVAFHGSPTAAFSPSISHGLSLRSPAATSMAGRSALPKASLAGGREAGDPAVTKCYWSVLQSRAEMCQHH